MLPRGVIRNRFTWGWDGGLVFCKLSRRALSKDATFPEWLSPPIAPCRAVPRVYAPDPYLTDILFRVYHVHSSAKPYWSLLDKKTNILSRQGRPGLFQVF